MYNMISLHPHKETFYCPWLVKTCRIYTEYSMNAFVPSLSLVCRYTYNCILWSLPPQGVEGISIGGWNVHDHQNIYIHNLKLYMYVYILIRFYMHKYLHTHEYIHMQLQHSYQHSYRTWRSTDRRIDVERGGREGEIERKNERHNYLKVKRDRSLQI